MTRNVSHDGAGRLEVRFPYDRSLVDLVKGLPSRRWHAEDKFWSVPESDVVPLVDLLVGRGFDFDRATRDLYVALGGRVELRDGVAQAPDSAHGAGQPGLFDDDVAPVGGDADYTVSRLNERAREALQAAFPSPVWLVGEISGFEKSSHKRHVTFELVERAADGRAVSKVPAVLFQATREQIQDQLSLAGDPFRLADELTVRVRVTVDLYAAWGQYRAVVEEIDLRYTLGEAARRREEIVGRLAAAGLLGRNDSVPLPEVPLRLGLITSLGSDAYNDVLRTLEESRFAFEVTAHGARVQGHSTEPSVLNALDWFRARADRFDIVLICRGGGSRTDLVWFDSEALGRAVAEFPLPVIVGIGHEQDRSVLDSVGRSAKTPTAAARLVVDLVQAHIERVERVARSALANAQVRLVAARGEIGRDGRRLALASKECLARARVALDAERRRAIVGARASIERARGRLDRAATLIPRDARLRLERERLRLVRAERLLRLAPARDLRAAREAHERAARTLLSRTLAAIGRNEERLEARARRLALVHPRRVLERGYAILRDEAGRVITSAASPRAGERVRAELRDGVLRLVGDGAERSGTPQGEP